MTMSAPSTFRRAEVKYPHASCAALQGALLAVGAQEQHVARTVNSIYFDTADLRDHEDGEEGITPRSKLRLRWYGAAEIGFPFVGQLELKTTLAGGREKSVRPVRAATSAELSITLHPLVPLWLRPQLQVSYERRYFVVGDGATRLTLDSRIRYRRCPEPARMGMVWVEDPQCVLEVKAGDRRAGIFRAVGLAEARFSKYCRGVLSLTIGGAGP